jgi:prepilin-type N-terminal cleavage/methylation domain-containing protein
MQILRKEDGFTLIETLSAMVILTIGMLGYFTLQASMVAHSRRAYDLSQASNYVSSQMEILRQLPYGDAALDPNLNHAHAILTPERDYNIFWTVTDDVPIVGAKSIAVRSFAAGRPQDVMTFHYVRYNDGT